MVETRYISTNDTLRLQTQDSIVLPYSDCVVSEENCNENVLNDPKSPNDSSTTVSNVNYDFGKALMISKELMDFMKDDCFEAGNRSSTEKYLEKMKYDTKDIVEALHWVFHDTDDVNTIVGVLHILGHLPGVSVLPTGPTLALAATRHSNQEVQERALMDFENWNLKRNLSLLRKVEIKEDWLSIYLQQVINVLENEGE